MDSYFTLKLFHLIEEKLGKPTLRLLTEVISEANSIFAEMEYEGMLVDREKLDEVGKALKDKNIEDNDQLYEFPEVLKRDNLSSNKDLIEILYTREGSFAVYPPDKTAKGAPSVSAPTLKLLLEYVNEELATR